MDYGIKISDDFDIIVNLIDDNEGFSDFFREGLAARPLSGYGCHRFTADGGSLIPGSKVP